MSSEKHNQFDEIEKGLRPSLPQVSNETVASVGGELIGQEDFISETFWRLISEQEALTEQISKYVSLMAQTPEEALHMKEVFVLTYAMLESQEKSNRLTETLILESDIPQPE